MSLGIPRHIVAPQICTIGLLRRLESFVGDGQRGHGFSLT